MARMGKKLQRLSSTLGGLLKARGMLSRLSEFRIFGQWEKTVGSLIARHASPVSLRGTRLFLAVDSPAWMQQLSLLKPEIIGKVNAALGKEAVKDITLNIGEVSLAEKKPTAQAPSGSSVLNAEDRERIESCIREIKDPEVKQAVRRVIEKDFLNKRRGQEKP